MQKAHAARSPPSGRGRRKSPVAADLEDLRVPPLSAEMVWSDPRAGLRPRAVSAFTSGRGDGASRPARGPWSAPHVQGRDDADWAALLHHDDVRHLVVSHEELMLRSSGSSLPTTTGGVDAGTRPAVELGVRQAGAPRRGRAPR